MTFLAAIGLTIDKLRKQDNSTRWIIAWGSFFILLVFLLVVSDMFGVEWRVHGIEPFWIP